MDANFFRTLMRIEPKTPEQKYVFLVDSEQLAVRITLSGFIATPILSFESDGRCFTLEAFIDYMRSLDFKGSCRVDYIYVLACSTKTVNDALAQYLTGESLAIKQGWKLFREKGYLEDMEHEEELKQILSEFIMIQEGSAGLPEISVRCVSEVTDEDVDWLVPGYIPGGQITLLVGDGGQGKTSVWCNLVAGITTGTKTVFDAVIPFEETSPTRKCMFFSSEDSVPKVLKKRLRKAGADETKILFVDLTDPNFDRIKFDAPELEMLISMHKPSLVVFDPLQSFIPASVQMGSRNAMRQCMSPLISLGEKYGTAFLIVMHTNKKLGVSGRTRCADSADIWDIARSVLIVGYTGEDGLHYLSQEKCNYSELSDTILYSIEDGAVVYKGTSDKRDRDYVSENVQAVRSSPARNEAKELILNILSDQEEHKVSDVDAMVKSSGVSFATLKRAKGELKTEGRVKYRCEGYGTEKVFYMSLRESDTK